MTVSINGFSLNKIRVFFKLVLIYTYMDYDKTFIRKLIKNKCRNFIFFPFFFQGSFSRTDFGFKVYCPATRDIQDSQVTDPGDTSFNASTSQVSDLSLMQGVESQSQSQVLDDTEVETLE